MKDRNWVVILPILFYVLAGFGYIRCAYKMFTCNWEPIGKAEAFYAIGTFTGAGVIIGYFDIEDK
jgi:hypothetical protein